MDHFFERLIQIPKLYGTIVVLVYSILVSEYISSINKLFMTRGIEITSILKTFMQLNFVMTILSGIVVWIVLCLLFHLTALLFNGKAIFGRFLIAASYPYVIPAIVVFIAILMLENVEVPDTDDIVQILEQNNRFQFIVNMVNYSFIPYYLIVSWIIHHLYRLKYPYAMLSVAVPICTIWGVTELFKLI